MMLRLIAIMLLACSSAWARVYVFTTETVTTVGTTTTTTQPPSYDAAWRDQIVLEYTFDDLPWTNVSGQVYDHSPSGNNYGTLGGTPTISTGVVYFGGSAYIQSAITDSLNNTTSFTFSVWYYRTGSWGGTMTPMATVGNAGKTTYFQQQTAFQRTAVLATVGGNTAQELNGRQWHMLTTTWDAVDNTVHFYIDAAHSTNVTSFTATGPMLQSNSWFIATSSALANYFTGYEDDALVVSRALTYIEVTNRYYHTMQTGGKW